MGIFGINYNKPGPGVSKNEPKKKSIKRFLELFTREFGNLVKLNLLFLLFVLPSAVLFILGFSGIGGVFSYILSAVLALPVGGAATAVIFCIAKMFRDEPGFIMFDFQRKFKENMRQTALPGLAAVVFIYMQIYICTNIAIGRMIAGYGTALLLIVSFIFFEMVLPYVFLQAAYVELTMIAIIKNSIFISIKNIAKSFCGMLFGQITFVVTFFLFPFSLWWIPILLIVGFSVSIMLNLMWIWPGVDEVFSISETLKELQEQKVSEISSVFSSIEPIPKR